MADFGFNPGVKIGANIPQFQQRPEAVGVGNPMQAQPQAQPNIPTQPMQSFDVGSNSSLPGIPEEKATQLISFVDKTARTSEEREMLLNDLHQEGIKREQQEAFKRNKMNMKSELMQRIGIEKDATKKQQMKLQVDMSNFADILRVGAKKDGVDITDMPDKDVVDKFMAARPEAAQDLQDFLGGKRSSIDIAARLGIIPQPEAPREKSIAENIVGGAAESVSGLAEFAGTSLASGIGYVAKSLGADETKVNQLVEDYKREWDTLGGETIGDEESMVYQGAKLVSDIMQVATPGGVAKGTAKVAKIGGKALEGSSAIAKTSKALSKIGLNSNIGTKAISKGIQMSDDVAKGSVNLLTKMGLSPKVAQKAVQIAGKGLEGTADVAGFTALSEQRLPTAGELALGGAVGVALPLAGIGVKKIAQTVAPKLQLSGLLNPAKLDRLKNNLLQEGAEGFSKATSEDVGQYMLDRGINGSKETIVTKLNSLGDEAIEAVDDIVSTSQAKIQNKTVDDVLGKLTQEYAEGTSKEVRNKLARAESLLTKSADEGLSLKEVNEVKKMMGDLNIFTSTGKVPVSKADLAATRRELRQLIEETAEETIEGVTANDVRLLNNEISMSRGLSEAISRKESADAAREMLQFLGGRAPGAALGGITANQAGGDWKTVLLGTFLGGLAGSTKIKTKAAKLLNKFNKSEATALQKYINSGGKDALTPKLQTKLDDVASKIKTLDEAIPELKVTVKAPEVMLNNGIKRGRVYSRQEMLDLGSDGYLTKAKVQEIPVNKVSGREPTPSMEGSFKGKEIKQPIEVQYDSLNDTYELYAGNHRITQAELNGQKTITAFVENYK